MKNRSPALFVCLALATPFAHADISGNIALLSDYRVKGISQTGENPAIQGGLEYQHGSGLFAGLWGSSVDYFAAGDPWDNNESVELDLYAGYVGAIGDTLGYDVTLFRYFYPGAIESIDFNEIKLGVNIGDARFGYGYANDYINGGKNYQYLEANYRVFLPADFGLDLHLGYSFGSVFNEPEAIWLDKYVDYSLTLSRTVGGIDLALTYMDTNIDAPYAIGNDYLANQNTWILGLSKRF